MDGCVRDVFGERCRDGVLVKHPRPLPPTPGGAGPAGMSVLGSSASRYTVVEWRRLQTTSGDPLHRRAVTLAEKTPMSPGTGEQNTVVRSLMQSVFRPRPVQAGDNHHLTGSGQGEVPMQRSLIILHRHFQVDRGGPTSVGCGA